MFMLEKQFDGSFRCFFVVDKADLLQRPALSEVEKLKNRERIARTKFDDR